MQLTALHAATSSLLPDELFGMTGEKEIHIDLHCGYIFQVA
jgi:hypothetical protein